MILPSLEGWNYTSLLLGVVILCGVFLMLFIDEAQLSISSLYIYLLFALSLLIPSLMMHSQLAIMVVKYLLMMLALFWLYNNTNSIVIKTRLVKRLVYFTLYLLLLNQVLGMMFGLGEVHLNSGLFFTHRYYGLLGDSVSLYVFFLWKYFRVMEVKKIHLIITLLIALSMGSKIVLLLIAFDSFYNRLRWKTIIYLLLSLSILSLTVFSFDWFNLNTIQYSLNTRMYSNVWAIQIFMNNPLAGIGFNQSSLYLALENFYEIAEDGVTFKIVMIDNTLLRLISENGFFGIISYILVLIILMRKIENKEMFYVLLLLQTFHWLEPISSALYSVLLTGILYRNINSSNQKRVL